ncbi:hypothetical protein RFI_09943 [Reticulomyxa filosa]|uniref:Uncharacterized protein n=1 Tax=Reticulomyxa filosa TaxID=46433 RepID=X6NMM8_RETFI|nr:hypothetical protein RFI_09943 [Reticulomyxa filosa]|eukprot:ETO27188.1 hypothetical protein RFI_09943 [Reticulomyxa filosa]
MSAMSHGQLFHVLSLPSSEVSTISNEATTSENVASIVERVESEKKQIIEAYERQLHSNIVAHNTNTHYNIHILQSQKKKKKRLMSHLSVSLKHIEFLESYRKRQNENGKAETKDVRAKDERKERHEECNYMYMHRQIYCLNEELVLQREMYQKKVMYISDEHSKEIQKLQGQIQSLQHIINDVKKYDPLHNHRSIDDQAKTTTTTTTTTSAVVAASTPSPLTHPTAVVDSTDTTNPIDKEEDQDIAMLKQSFNSLRRTLSKRTMRGSDLQKQVENLKLENEMLQV